MFGFGRLASYDYFVHLERACDDMHDMPGSERLGDVVVRTLAHRL